MKTKSSPFSHHWLWTWDHSTNWALGCDGQVEFGSANAYLKPAEAFVADYRLLIDAAVRYRVNGIIVWGLLRDSHGGVDAANEICRYAKQHGVRIITGIGTSEYGGFYYEGNHRFNAATMARLRPEGICPSRHGSPYPKVCPADPANAQWLREGTQWLLENVEVGGLNLENGDFSACPNDRCRQAREKMGGDDPDYYQDMLMSILPVIEESGDTLVSYATYTGFLPGDPAAFDTRGGVRNPVMQRGEPLFARKCPSSAIAEWNIGGMIHHDKVPLRVFLDDGDPAGFESPYWPNGLKPPTKHNVGFVHQGSQWHTRQGRGTRYSMEIAAIKEACLRGAESGLDGLIIHGEVSDRCVPYELNYRAFAYFTHHPLANLREFARAELTDLCGGEDLAVTFVEMLADSEMGVARGHELKLICEKFRRQVERGEDYHPYRRWHWLAQEVGIV